MSDARARVQSAVIAALVALVSACGAALGPGAGGEGHAAAAFGGQVPVTLFNDTASTVCFVRMAPSAARRWGDDWLGAEETVPTGAERTFGIAGGPSWNIRIEGCDGGVIAQTTGLALTSATRMAVSTLRPAPGEASAVGSKPPARGNGSRTPWTRPRGSAAPTDQYPSAPGMAPPVTY